MNTKEKGFIRTRIKSVTYVFKGMQILIKTEDSIKVQCSVGLLVIILGFIFDISVTEWMIQLTLIGLVLVAESLNTAIEKVANFMHPDFHEKIGVIKDVAAGAAGFAAIFAGIIGSLIYIPKIYYLFS